MSANIFQLWKNNGEVLPFPVRRDSWSDINYLVVHEVVIGRWPYGTARGTYYFNGKAKSEELEDISCAGCYQWQLLDMPGYVRGSYKGKRRKLKVYGMDDLIDFGKYYHPGLRKGMKTIGQILSEDPAYIRWCMQNIDSFRLDEDSLKVLNPQDPPA